MDKNLRKYVVLAVVLAALLIGMSLLAYKEPEGLIRAVVTQAVHSPYSFLTASLLILIAILTAITLHRTQKKKNNPRAQTESAQKLQLNVAEHNR